MAAELKNVSTALSNANGIGMAGKLDVRARNAGLFRSVLAGPGHTLADVFAKLERVPQVERVLRHAKRDLLSARVSLPSEEGEGYWEFTRIRDEIYVVVANFAYKDRRVEFVPGDGLIQFNFKLSGDMTLAVNPAEPLRWNRPSLLVWAQPQGVDTSEWTAASARERYITISVRPEFLTDHLSTSGAELPKRLPAFLSGAKIEYCQLPLSPLMFEVASRLIDNPLPGALGLVMTEALALELLCSAVHGFCAPAGPPAEGYSERELRCLHAARRILMRQFAPVPTIGALARSIGMAESALTRTFKCVFGQTIFDFSLGCRMQHALTLIRDRRCSVAQVSEAVGYAHPTSFTTAFRRHFGIRPMDVRHVRSRLATGMARGDESPAEYIGTPSYSMHEQRIYT
jgi:AraC family transcriptional regulator, transcriptional activator of the genes for pyochelin and ferripyochelin receptors